MQENLMERGKKKKGSRTSKTVNHRSSPYFLIFLFSFPFHPHRAIQGPVVLHPAMSNGTALLGIRSSPYFSHSHSHSLHNPQCAILKLSSPIQHASSHSGAKLFLVRVEQVRHTICICARVRVRQVDHGPYHTMPATPCGSFEVCGCCGFLAYYFVLFSAFPMTAFSEVSLVTHRSEFPPFCLFLYFFCG